MFKLVLLFSALCAVASAGYLAGGLGSLGGHGYGLTGYSAYSAPAIHSAVSYSAPIIKSYAAPAVVSAPIIKSYAAPAVVSAPLIKTYAAAPIVKTYAPLATSYANTYKIATKSVPVVHAAPAIAVHSAPAVIAAAPAYHSTATYHGLGALGLGHGYGGYGHSLYH